MFIIYLSSRCELWEQVILLLWLLFTAVSLEPSTVLSKYSKCSVSICWMRKEKIKPHLSEGIRKCGELMTSEGISEESVITQIMHKK